MAEQNFLGRELVMSNSSDIERMFSDLKKLIVQAFGTPRWISELSVMADEVRDRTILVKINSQRHSWSDLGISCLFSEIGIVEEVRYLPTESGFHSLVRFQTQYSSQYAYHYYNGRCLHQDCCKVEIHRPDGIISWNAQKVDEIKATYGISDVPVEACDANLHKGRLECDELIHRDEEPSQILVQNEPNSAKESSVLVAHQVLEEMPRPFVNDELVFLDEVEKINDELLDEMNSEAPPFGSVDELDGVKVIEDGELRDAIPTIHALKLPTEFSEKESMMNGVVCMICFDPGGNNLSHRDHAMCLSNKNFESVVGEDNKSIDGVFSQLKESYLAVGQDTQISYVAEHELQDAAAQDGLKVFRGGMTMIYMGLMCFDPGGLVARVVCPVDNDLGGLESTSLLHNYTSCFAIYHKLAFGVNCAMSRIRGIFEVLIDFLPFLHENKSNTLYGQELEVTIAYNKDPSPLKLNLGVGAYRTEEGKPLVLNVVRKAEQLLVNDLSRVKEYPVCVICFDPGGLLVIDAFSCLIANEKSHFGHSVGTLIFYPGRYVVEVLVFLQAFDYEMSAYLGWSAKIKSCLLDVFKETSNMLSCSLGNTKPDEEHKTLKVFEVNDLQYITPLLLAINEFSSFVQFPSKLPAQKVRMVDYIVVVCFSVWVFDPGGHLLIHATFGVAENLLNASAENIIENLLNTSAVHGHLDVVFDPRGSELMSRDRAICLFNESDFAFVIPSPCLEVDINEARHQRIKITNHHLVTVAAMMGVANMYAQWDASLTLAEFWRIHTWIHQGS